MKIIEPSVVVIKGPDIEIIEKMGRICYRSEPKGAVQFFNKLVKMGHTSVLEHSTLSCVVVCSRACSHQIVRHRIGMAVSQESQRYCENKLEFINYPGLDKEQLKLIEQWYVQGPGSREDRRMILPNCTATKLGLTFNLRALLWFFELRCSKKAQWEIRKIAESLKEQFEKYLEPEPEPEPTSGFLGPGSGLLNRIGK